MIKYNALVGIFFLIFAVPLPTLLYCEEGTPSEVVNLTEIQKKEINELMSKALASPRKLASSSLYEINKMGAEAAKYASPKIAELLFIPVEVNVNAGSDLLMLETLKMLRSAPKLDKKYLDQLKVIAKSKNIDHAGFAEIVLSRQDFFYNK